MKAIKNGNYEAFICRYRLGDLLSFILASLYDQFSMYLSFSPHRRLQLVRKVNRRQQFA